MFKQSLSCFIGCLVGLGDPQTSARHSRLCCKPQQLLRKVACPLLKGCRPIAEAWPSTLLHTHS